MSLNLRISKFGYNALTETDPNNYIFDALKNTFKIISELSTSYTTSNSWTVVITHGLGYIPFVFAFFKYGDTGRVGLIGQSDSGNPSGRRVPYIRVDDDKIYINLQHNAASITYYFKVFVTEVPL